MSEGALGDESANAGTPLTGEEGAPNAHEGKLQLHALALDRDVALFPRNHHFPGQELTWVAIRCCNG